MADQLTLPGGEPRYTKIKGENRYYDHALGKSVSHRQYWTIRKQAEGNVAATPAKSKWTPEKAQALRKEPTPIRKPPEPVRAAGSDLAKQLLEQSMPGSPIVDTPRAPSPIKSQLNEIAEDTKKSVESLAESVSPALAAILIFVAVLIVPEEMRWLVPEQEEGELILEPAARLIIRYVGITGKQLGENGSDIISLVVAFAAYAMGAKSRLDEYLETVEGYEDEPEQVTPATAAGSRAGARSGGQPRTATAAYDSAARPAAYAAVSQQNTQQSNTAASRQTVATGPITSLDHATERQRNDAEKIRALFNADFEGRRRLGYA